MADADHLTFLTFEFTESWDFGVKKKIMVVLLTFNSNQSHQICGFNVFNFNGIYPRSGSGRLCICALDQHRINVQPHK